MDLCICFDVDGQSSLYVEDIEGAYTDEEISNVFEVSGDISKVVRIPDESGQPEGRVLVKFSSDRPISSVNPSILATLPSPLDPSVVWSV